jgi:hypothetical protein
VRGPLRFLPLQLVVSIFYSSYSQKIRNHSRIRDDDNVEFSMEKWLRILFLCWYNLNSAWKQPIFLASAKLMYAPPHGDNGKFFIEKWLSAVSIRYIMENMANIIQVQLESKQQFLAEVQNWWTVQSTTIIIYYIYSYISISGATHLHSVGDASVPMEKQRLCPVFHNTLTHIS